MAKKKRDTPKWEFLNLKTGVFAGIVGIIGVAVTIYATLKPDEKKDLETIELQNRISSYEPAIEVAYADIIGDIYTLSRDQEAETEKAKTFFLNYPVMSNELTILKDSIMNADSLDHEPGDTNAVETHCIYLILENKGKSAAADIEITINRYELTTAVSINEDMTKTEKDYENIIRNAAVGSKTTFVKLPQSLEGGRGILIPLMVSRIKRIYGSSYRPWDLISRVAYIPKSIQYKSSLSQKIIKKDVRKMVTPVRIAGGVEIRG